MGANEIQQSMLEAMQLLSQKAADSTNAAITIKGEIVEELDPGLRNYSVSYGGTIYKDCYALGDVKYSSSTVVYILIPDGNFDEPKIILRAASASATNYETESETDIYVPISSNLFGIENSIDLRSWEDKTQNLDLDTANFGLVFQDYLTTNRNFVFSALVKTEIDKDHQAKGNYGLILNLPFVQAGSEGSSTQIWKSYVMDVSTMQGNPYAFNEYNKINLYYTVDDTLEYDITRVPFITAFTQDFGYTEPRTDIQYDIHIKNIAVKMVDVLSEADTTGYYLAVVPTEGNYFLSGKYVNKKTLSPLLKVKSKTTDVKGWDCYWFVEDSSVDISSEGYLSIGGLGWKCLNKKINVTYDAEGNKTFQYVTTNYTLDVSDSDVISALRYKCVLTKDSVIVGGSVRLKNLNSRIEVSLISATGKNTYIENIGNVRLIARCYYPGITDDIGLSTVWQRFDQDGNYIDNNFYTISRWNDKKGDYIETEISYPCSILEKLNTINCTFYSTITNNGTTTQNNLGTASIIITTTKEMTYGVTIDGGDVLYKYDADGDSPMVANYDGPASSQIKTIQPLSFRIFKPDGSELDSTEYLYAHYKWSFPKNSMMKPASAVVYTSEDDNYYYIEGWGTSSINYTILPTYNKKKSDNAVLLQVEIDGNQISDSTNPKFLKDGEGGTNGSKYAAILTYDSYAYGERDSNGKIRKLQAVWIPGQNWKIYDAVNNTLIDFNSPRLVPIVYRDGERITSGYNVAWSMFDVTQTDPAFSVVGGVLSQRAQWTDPSEIFCSVVECAVTITESSKTNSQEVIYAYYPIEITRLLNNSMASKVIPNLDGGFEEVVYASDGTNPQYDNTNSFECVDNLYNDDQGDYYDYNWVFSNNLKRSGGGTGSSAVIKPVTKFDNGLTKNYIKVTLSMSASKRAEIQAKISQLGTEITNTQNKINFYLNNKTHVLDFVKNFSYNFYEGKLKNSKQLLQYRFELLNYIPRLREILEELNSYCIQNNIRISDFNYTRYYSLYNSTLTSVYKNLYLLGYNRELSDISDLSGSTIAVNTSLLTNNYGAAVAQQILNLASMWNTLIIKYQEIYVKIVQQSGQQYVLQSEYDSLASFDDTLDDFVNDSNLSYLITSHDGNNPEPEFVRLQASLIALYNKITDVNGELISYSTFVDLLKQIQNELSIYLNTDYQNTYYNNILTELNNTLTSLQGDKSSYEAMLLPAASDYITHIKPIVMIFNRYELGNINGWDGSKLYIDQTNNEYLLAPQVGAGVKKNGLFTGVVMGIKQFNASSTQHIGLFGYGSGIQSFFLNSEDGSLILGKSGSGQIISDPSQSKALLYSSNYWKNYNNDGKPSSYGSTNLNGAGMLIDLTTPEIRFGSGNFIVNSSGHITAKGGGSIAGWKINDTQIYSNVTTANGRLTLDSTNQGKIYSHAHSSLTSTTQGFYLSYDGLSLGNSIRISSANNGTILVGRVNGSRTWTISGNANNSFIAYGTRGANNSVYISTNEITLGSKFYVNDEGTMRVGAGAVSGSGSHWTIDSSSGNSYIGYRANSLNFDFDDDSIGGSNNSVYLGTDGIRLGTHFAVDNNGNMSAKNIKIKGSAQIGDWSIENGKIVGERNNGRIELDAKGSINGGSGDNTWSIDRDGDATFNNITCQKIWTFGTNGGNQWTQNGFNFSGVSGSLATTFNSGTGLAFGLGTIGLGLTSGGVPSARSNNGIYYNNGNLSIKGDIYANNGYFSGTIEASKFKFDDRAGHSMEMGYSSDHPKVSGLNVLSAGISMDGTHGISKCANIGNGGAVWTFYPSISHIKTDSYVNINGGSSYLLIANKTLSEWTQGVVEAYSITGTITDSTGKPCNFDLSLT